MKNNNKLFRGFNIFFSLFGLITFVLLVSLFITNLTGVGTLLSVVGLIEAQSLKTVDGATMIEGATTGIVESLEDPYSRYLNEQQWEDLRLQINAEFGGIGVYFVQLPDGKLQIVAPIKGTPGEREGLKSGDIITRINGESAIQMDQDDAVALMRGDPGTQLELSVFREADGKEHDFKIIREIINVPSVEEKVLPGATSIGYVQLSHFSAHSAQEIADSLNGLSEENIQGVILDLRNNGGGDFEAAISIANIFLDDKEIVSVKDVRERTTVHKSAPDSYTLPMVVLVNENSASSSEILSGALQDNGRAVLVGQNTYGKGLVQTVFPLRGGGALKLTTQKYFTPDGTDINEIGIKPDYVVDIPEDATEDVQLQRAIEVLKKQIL
ncbi:MAG: S41 family peptidase [Bacillota bacterium]|nr:S41 family peptidase [Bacillota bacterium]